MSQPLCKFGNGVHSVETTIVLNAKDDSAWMRDLYGTARRTRDQVLNALLGLAL